MITLRRFRFGIAQIMLLVLGVGLAIGSLRSPSPLLASVIWTMIVSLLCWSVVAATLGKNRRAFWAGFAVFGWVHLVVIFDLYRFTPADSENPPLPALLTSYLIDYLRDHVPPRSGLIIRDVFNFIGFPLLEFEQIARLLTTLLAALIGGGLSRLVGRRPDATGSPATSKFRED